jgi:hypothetical protein
MPATHITIQEAAELSGKSIQTIRRAIKAKKISARRKKTPQGFNYSIKRDSIIKCYKLRIDTKERKSGGLKRKGKGGAVAKNYATVDDLRRIQDDMEDLIAEQRKAKDSFMRFMKTFQERFVVLENQLKLLEEPKDKRWYQFWK